MIFSSHSCESSNELTVLLSVKFHIITEAVDSVDEKGIPSTSEAINTRDLDLRLNHWTLNSVPPGITDKTRPSHGLVLFVCVNIATSMPDLISD